MKYLINCNHDFCREHGKAISEIMEKMYAIGDNIEFLVETLKEQYPNDIIPESLQQKYAEQVLVDLSSVSDEFYVGDGKDDLYIEVVTKKVAISNDKDFLSDYSVEERKAYKLADGEYSMYTKLADTNYYFRFM